jgi:hypothetical protein
MQQINHKDVGGMYIILEWTGFGKRFAFAKSYNRGYRTSWREDSIIYRRSKSVTKTYYCLWGTEDKHLEQLAAIECLTKGRRPRKESSALKLFWEMVRSAEHVTIK